MDFVFRKVPPPHSYDGKFVASVREQLEQEKKPLSERQCSALLGVLARYAAKDASLRAAAEAAGFGELVRQQQAVEAAREEQRENTAAVFGKQ